MMPTLFSFSAPFWGRGFRPFFMAAALYNVLIIGAWGLFFQGYALPLPEGLGGPMAWHAHEMVYGVVLAVVAGFLLTAVANWTGGAPARQKHLFFLFLLWVIGRIVLNFDLGLPHWGVVALGTIFIPALAISLSISLIKTRNKRNFIFLSFLTVLFGADVCFLVFTDMRALYVAIFIFMMMISLIGGRIIPAFTVAALRRLGKKAFQVDQMPLDVMALFSLILTALLFVTNPQSVFCGLTAGLAAMIHALRMRSYYVRSAFQDPMLWILHLGYMWIVLGLVLISAASFDLVPRAAALHAITMGGIGSLTLGMMTRVTLGHTGRVMQASRLTVLSFIFVQIAALERVFGPLLDSGSNIFWIVTAAIFWSLAFLIYLIVYTPMLVSARPDGEDV